MRSSLSRIFPDPRIPILLLLAGYLALGFTVLGFNRSPSQVAVTAVLACALELGLGWLFYRRVEFPLSALITSLGLSILLNYSHSHWLLIVPVFFAIGSKYLFQFQGRHAFNPAMIGVVLSLLLTSELITSAPAYQWYGVTSMAYFILFPALMFFMPSIDRSWLVGSFLITFCLQVALRAWIMRHHLPFMTLFLGTLSSPSFLLFTFFMITDPRTSPKDRGAQIRAGVALAVLDLLFHIRQSYYTFFYAAFTLASVKLVWNHARAAGRSPLEYFARTFVASGYWKRPALLGALALGGVAVYGSWISPSAAVMTLDWKLESLSPSVTGIDTQWGKTYDRLDPRIQHIAKWILSIGDSVAAGDFDGDGKPDLFFTSPLMSDGNRLALYRNLGDFRFERVRVPALEERARAIEKFGLGGNAVWADTDNDGDLDLFVTYAFGSPVLLRNMLRERGRAEFVDVTGSAGLEHYTNSVAATFLDVNRDGRLDLVIANVLPNTLPGGGALNLFHLPDAQYAGDRRMFDFMHESWNLANNGGLNELWLQGADGRFSRQDSAAWGMPETRWSLALGTSDFNHDGWPDFYVANDFGPDDLYLNEGGKHFRNVKGSMFGSIGRDTYKGMNVSVEDFDRNGWQDVYVSNVHHDMQAEGSLLWMFGPGDSIVDRATQAGALNERRFGWGAAAADLDNDGWMDIMQANGMVDDSRDARSGKCPDYWYINEKLARSPPSIHRYADAWGDIRGACIHPREANRVYLNRGNDARPQFVDVAEQTGFGEKSNSRGIAAVDLDSDGRVDLVVTHMFRRPDVFRNAGPRKADWVGFTLAANSAGCNRQGVGSTVRVGPVVRELQAVSGFSGQGDRRLHFGLGAVGGDVTAEVNWCGLKKETFTGLRPGKYHELLEGGSNAKDASHVIGGIGGGAGVRGVGQDGGERFQ